MSGLLLIAASCVAPPAPVVVAPIPPGQARVWFYRPYEPSETFNLAELKAEDRPRYNQLDGTPQGTSTAGNQFVALAILQILGAWADEGKARQCGPDYSDHCFISSCA
jgi:hypothetical protein